MAPDAPFPLGLTAAGATVKVGGHLFPCVLSGPFRMGGGGRTTERRSCSTDKSGQKFLWNLLSRPTLHLAALEPGGLHLWSPVASPWHGNLF